MSCTPAKPPLSPSEWFERFVQAFNEAASDGNSELGIHYAKREVRKRDTLDAEWTELVKVFLSRLARREGYFQEWESEGRVDLLWYEEDRMIPSVAIEHENKSEGVNVSEVPKLCGTDAPLKVLITYFDKHAQPEEELCSKVALALEPRARRTDFGEFLLILGERKERLAFEWWGYVWDRNDECFRPAPKWQKVVRCKKCEKAFTPWGAGHEFCNECEPEEIYKWEMEERVDPTVDRRTGKRKNFP